MGDGYWNGTLNDWPYTIATATTGAAGHGRHCHFDRKWQRQKQD
jgi:hypothetical protein